MWESNNALISGQDHVVFDNFYFCYLDTIGQYLRSQIILLEGYQTTTVVAIPA